MSGQQSVDDSRVELSHSGLPTWWVVFTRELTDLWVGGRALYLILIYSIVLGIIAYVLASSSELSLIPPKEMVFETLKDVIAIAAIISLIIGADSISGERERATLEALLLTPTSRRQIVVGKFLAAVSPWPVALAITVPYWSVLSQGDEVFGPAVLWSAIMGSLLAAALAGLGMLASIWSNSNKTSFFVSLGIYVLLLIPSKLPGTAQTGATGEFLQWVNPTAATDHFLAKILVNNRTLDEFWPWLTTPVVFPILVLGLLFLYASPNLRLETGKASAVWRNWGRVAGLILAACLMVSLGAPSATAFEEAASVPSELSQVREGEQTTLAAPLAEPQPPQPGEEEETPEAEPSTGSKPPQPGEEEKTPRSAASPNPELPLQLSVNLGYKEVKAGDPILFNTMVTNNGSEESPPVTLAMNIINLEATGDVVDPEDWSPERTQYTEHLAPGQSVKHSWRVNAILDGDYLVYIVVIPEPNGPEATSQPVASSGIHLTVAPYTSLNPGGVLPLALGTPIGLTLVTSVVHWLRRRGIDTGGSE